MSEEEQPTEINPKKIKAIAEVLLVLFLGFAIGYASGFGAGVDDCNIDFRDFQMTHTCSDKDLSDLTNMLSSNLSMAPVISPLTTADTTAHNNPK